MAQMAPRQGMAGNGHGAVWSPLESPQSLREIPEELNVPPKIFWFLSHKLQ